MNALTYTKTLWAWMIKNAYFNARPSYYGGVEFVTQNLLGVSTQKGRMVDYRVDILAKVAEIGIDWDKTSCPCTDYSYEFDGTENDSRRVKIIKGSLFLKDGTELKCFVDTSEVDEYLAVCEHLRGRNIQGIIGDACRAARKIIDFDE